MAEKVFDPTPVEAFATEMSRMLQEIKLTMRSIEKHVHKIWRLPPRRLRDQLRLLRINLCDVGQKFNDAIQYSPEVGKEIRSYKPISIRLSEDSEDGWNPRRTSLKGSAAMCYVYATTILEFLRRCMVGYDMLKDILQEETNDLSWKSTTLFDPQASQLCSDFEAFWSDIIKFCDGGYPGISSGPTMAQVLLWDQVIHTLENLQDPISSLGLSFILEDRENDPVQPIPILRDKTSIQKHDEKDHLQLPESAEPYTEIRNILPFCVETVKYILSTFQCLYRDVIERWEVPPLEVQDVIQDLRESLYILLSDFVSHLDVAAEVSRQCFFASENSLELPVTRAQSQLLVLVLEAEEIQWQLFSISRLLERNLPLLSFSFERLPSTPPERLEEETFLCCIPRSPKPKDLPSFQPTRLSFCPRQAILPRRYLRDPPPQIDILDRISKGLKFAPIDHLNAFYVWERRLCPDVVRGSLPREVRDVAISSLPHFENAAKEIRKQLTTLDISNFPFQPYVPVKVVSKSKSGGCCIS